MSAPREGKQSPYLQGEDEILAYTITTTPWASAPTSPTAKIFSYTLATETYTDVTSTKMVGAASANGDVITTPAITSLVAGTQYRVEVKFVVASNTFEVYFWIAGER